MDQLVRSSALLEHLGPQAVQRVPHVAGAPPVHLQLRHPSRLRAPDDTRVRDGHGTALRPIRHESSQKAALAPRAVATAYDLCHGNGDHDAPWPLRTAGGFDHTVRRGGRNRVYRDFSRWATIYPRRCIRRSSSAARHGPGALHRGHLRPAEGAVDFGRGWPRAPSARRHVQRSSCRTPSSRCLQNVKALVGPGKVEQVLCTGNLCSPEVLVFLRSLCSDVTCVQGDFDPPGAYHPSATKKIGNWAVGILHGHQIVPWGDKGALKKAQNEMKVDVSGLRWSSGASSRVLARTTARPSSQLLICGNQEEFSILDEGDNRVLCPGSACASLGNDGSSVHPGCAPSLREAACSALHEAAQCYTGKTCLAFQVRGPECRGGCVRGLPLPALRRRQQALQAHQARAP